MIAETAIKMTISTRIQNTCFLSLISFTILSLIRSIVSVELEAMTKEDKVDIEADNTRITTRAINKGCKFSSIVGMIESYPLAAISILSEKRRPKPPKK